MNIITVIPLSRSKVAPFLSYFTSSEVPVGSIVSVPMRSKTIHAIVSKTENAEDVKQDIKGADFVIRKLNKIKATVFFPASFMESAAILAEYYASTAGAVIDSLVSDVILENASIIQPPLPRQSSFGTGDAMKIASKEATYAIQGDDADRFSSWRSLIRQEFARKRSIAVYVPTIDECDNIYDALEKGIEGYIFKLNGGMTKKKILDVWTAISDTDHPVVIIATGSFSVLPREDVDTVIIERENGRGWKAQKAPYLDIRHSLEVIARKRKQAVFVADSLLSCETLHRLETGEIERGSPFKWRSVSDARDLLVDMKSHKQTDSAFRVISPELEDLIRSNHENNTHLFILTLRRGHSPMTVCDDCETIVSCRSCTAPVILHTSPESGKNFFMCHKCGERRSAEETCANCDSWRLTPLGIGIDRVADEIRKRFPDTEVHQIDRDSTSTDKKIDEAIEKFRSRPGSILIGTELALLHLSGKIDHVAVASLDSLFALPDFRMEEKIMYMLVRLRSQATRSILVQTRRIEEKVFEYGLKGNLSDYYRMAIASRKQHRYPPFSALIKITIEGKKADISEKMAEIKSLVEPRELDVFPAFTSTVKGKSVIHGLISIDSNAWPDQSLVAKLRSLPPGISVKVDPESLL